MCGNFIIALYLAQVASNNYDCLRESYFLNWYDCFGWNRYEYTLALDSMESTAMTRLIIGLGRGNGDACSLLDTDGVSGVDWNELFDRGGFSELHKIVYGISSQPLDAEIEARPENLDRLDGIGLTALWYACWLGNSDHIRTLIRHGADVNNAAISPICAAVWRRSYDSVEQLLNTGALIVDQSIGILYHTLICPIGHREDVEELLAIDKALFGRLIDINYSFRLSIYGQNTPLLALIWGRTPHLLPRMRQLLELGADTELCDGCGLTPLYHVILAGNAEACKILGRAGANANTQSNIGGTILHAAIMFADHPDIIQAVSELALSGVELGAKGISGCTAFELFEIRSGTRRPPVKFNIPRWWFDKYFHIDTQLQILSSFQTLLQRVQESQGIPTEDRYPLFSLTHESLTVNHIENWSSETVLPSIPGAWPDG